MISTTNTIFVRNVKNNKIIQIKNKNNIGLYVLHTILNEDKKLDRQLK